MQIPQNSPLSVNPNVSSQETPIPLSILKQDLLESYMPAILAEVDKELSEQNDHRTHRCTREYGFSFFKMEKNDFYFDPPPHFLQNLGAEVAKACGDEPVYFTNIILSVYDADFNLEPHADVSEKNRYGDAAFYFGEKVYGLVVEADPTGHLYFVKWEDGIKPPLNLEKIYEVEEKPGSAFCLTGEYRTSPYFHGVSKVSKRRISLTFRTVIQTK